MSTEPAIPIEGKTISILPGTMFRVELDNNQVVLALRSRVSGRSFCVPCMNIVIAVPTPHSKAIPNIVVRRLVHDHRPGSSSLVEVRQKALVYALAKVLE
jgi:translation initiation factor IF-1